jgi:hypothetical protein
MPDNPMPSWFGFLRVEADLAMTFIGVAQVHLRPEHSARSLENARKALAQIQRCLMDATYYGISEVELALLEHRCTLIESALREFRPGKQV